MVFGGLFRGFVPAFDPGGVVAAVPWWLSGGVAAANCLAAYTPKGAASLAASYDNNAAPGNGLADGTYDAALGVAPTFNAATGWTFNGSSQYLTTGIVPASGYSMIVLFSGGSGSADRSLAGYHKVGARFRLDPEMSVVQHTYASGGFTSIAGNLTSGTMAIAGQYGYKDGVLDTGEIGAWTATADSDIYIGTVNGLARWWDANIMAVAIYNTTISAAQVLAVSTAMAAL